MKPPSHDASLGEAFEWTDALEMLPAGSQLCELLAIAPSFEGQLLPVQNVSNSREEVEDAVDRDGTHDRVAPARGMAVCNV